MSFEEIWIGLQLLSWISSVGMFIMSIIAYNRYVKPKELHDLEVAVISARRWIVRVKHPATWAGLRGHPGFEQGRMDVAVREWKSAMSYGEKINKALEEYIVSNQGDDRFSVSIDKMFIALWNIAAQWMEKGRQDVDQVTFDVASGNVTEFEDAFNTFQEKVRKLKKENSLLNVDFYKKLYYQVLKK